MTQPPSGLPRGLVPRMGGSYLTLRLPPGPFPPTEEKMQVPSSSKDAPEKLQSGQGRSKGGLDCQAHSASGQDEGQSWSTRVSRIQVHFGIYCLPHRLTAAWGLNGVGGGEY